MVRTTAESGDGVQVPRVHRVSIFGFKPPITIDCREIGYGITKKNKKLNIKYPHAVGVAMTYGEDFQDVEDASFREG